MLFSLHAQKNQQQEYFVKNGDTIVTNALFIQRPYKSYELKAQATNGESFNVSDMFEEGITAFKINSRIFELLTPAQTEEKHLEYYNKLITGKLTLYADSFGDNPGMFNKWSKLEHARKFLKFGDQQLMPLNNENDMNYFFETILQNCPAFQTNNTKKIKEENLVAILKTYNHYCE